MWSSKSTVVPETGEFSKKGNNNLYYIIYLYIYIYYNVY